MRTEQLKKNAKRTTYESLQEILSYTKRNQECLNAGNNGSTAPWRDSGKQDKSWLGCDSSEQVLEFVKTGWNAGANKMREKLDHVEAPPCQSVKRQRRRGATGDDIDIQRVWSGQLETAWEKMEKTFQPGPRRVRIVVNVGDNCGTEADEMFWRGATALRLTETLQEAGYAVEIAVMWANKEYDENYTEQYDVTYVTIKPYGEDTSIAHLAATTALAGFFRVVGFAAMLRQPAYKMGLGLGQMQSVAEYMPEAPNELTVLVDRNVRDAHTANAEVARVLAMLDTQQAA